MASNNLPSGFFDGLSNFPAYIPGGLGGREPREELQLLPLDEGSHTGEHSFDYRMLLRSSPLNTRLDLSLDQAEKPEGGGGHGSGNRFSDETISSFPTGLSGFDHHVGGPMAMMPCDEGSRLSLDQAKEHGSENIKDNVPNNRYLSMKPVFQGQPKQQPAPSVPRAQATDSHSFPQLVHEDRIAEQIRALQQTLVPTMNKVFKETFAGKKRTTTEKSNFEAPPKPRKKQARRAEVWQHFTQNEDDRAFSNCRYCSQEIGCDSKKNGTSAMKNHIARCKAYQEKDNQKVLGGDKDDSSLFKRSVNEMIVLNELPFDFLESEGFRRFCTKMLPKHTVHCRKTVTEDVLAMFQREKAALKNLFSFDNQRVSLTANIWVAPTTSYNYMMITAHWIDGNWNMQKRIISFKPVTDQKGETIAKHLTSCLAEWGIKKVFTVTMDNTTENGKGVRLFRDACRRMGPEALVRDGGLLAICCCAYILNWIARTGIAKVSKSIVAVKDAVKYVQSSDERLKSFGLMVESEKVSSRTLSLECVTKWKSTYLMLTAALKYRVAFDNLLAGDKLYNEYFRGSENGPPTSNNWDEVQRLVKLLKIFFNGSLALSASKTVTSTIWYNEIVIIKKNLISLRHNNDITIRMEAETMKSNFEMYWGGPGGLHNFNLVIIASVFDPRNKMQFASICFDNLYGKDSVQSTYLKSSIMKLMKELYEEYVMRLNTSSQGDSVENMSDNGESELESDFSDDDGYERRDSLYSEMVSDSGNEKDELDIYLMEKLVPRSRNNLTSDYDVLSWWRSNSPKYPILSELARDVLAIQVSSVASESAFSTIGRTLDPYRSSLTPDLIESLICTQQWLKSTKEPC